MVESKKKKSNEGFELAAGKNMLPAPADLRTGITILQEKSEAACETKANSKADRQSCTCACWWIKDAVLKRESSNQNCAWWR